MSVVTTLAPVGRVLLRDQALERIREAIVAGELAPGSVIKDAALAARLGLSVAPVRAALARLADEGLVEAKPQSHTRVTPLVVRQVRDAAVVVRAMHELAAREAAGRVTGADVAAMRAANGRFAAAVAAGDVDAAVAADDDLHGVLLARAANGALPATVERFTPAIRRLERLRFTAAGAHPSVDLHDRLIAACAAHDVDAAVATTTEIWTALLSELEADPDGARRLPPLSAAVRPLAGAPPGPAHRAPRRRRRLGQAGGRELRHRLRRQQDPQAGVPRRRRPRPGLRHARLDRRCAEQPHPPGRRGGRARRAEVRARA